MLLDEVRGHRWEWSPESIYWGGGTPSLMPLRALAEVMLAIPHKAVTESTLECAPGTVTCESAQAWQQCGINRVSFGVQSFVIEEARRTGRKHTPEIVESDIKLLADGGNHQRERGSDRRVAWADPCLLEYIARLGGADCASSRFRLSV